MIKIASVALTAALVLVSPAPASAQWVNIGDNCSTGTIRTCASFQASAISYAGGTRTQLYLRVRNLYAILSDGTFGGSILTRFGVLAPELSDTRDENVLGFVGGTQTVFEEGNATQTGDAASQWAFHPRTNSLGKVEWALASGATQGEANGGIKDCIGPDADPNTYFTTCAGGVPDGWVTFALTTAGVINASDLQLAWGVISVSSDGQGSGDLGSFQGSTGVIPEPATMVLLATGLVGLAAVGRRRRRTAYDLDEGV